ncbi:hypothetical protein LJR225_003126 [Phenylobacterium sp. LjRoot225]|uniref:hypothetical protein n=1 Tax=Phenylobacterium sp. LjRoot225 TaxID=3342285 RepID=UPI003ECC7665
MEGSRHARLSVAILLSLWAGAAQAETWRILHWDRFSLIAVDTEHRRTTGLSNPALPVLELKLYPSAADAEAQVGEQEVDCADQRVRTRTRQQFFGADQQTGVDTEIQPWRDPGEERDRLLVRALCNPSACPLAYPLFNTTGPWPPGLDIRVARVPARPAIHVPNLIHPNEAFARETGGRGFAIREFEDRAPKIRFWDKARLIAAAPGRRRRLLRHGVLDRASQDTLVEHLCGHARSRAINFPIVVPSPDTSCRWLLSVISPRER